MLTMHSLTCSGFGPVKVVDDDEKGSGYGCRCVNKSSSLFLVSPRRMLCGRHGPVCTQARVRATDVGADDTAEVHSRLMKSALPLGYALDKCDSTGAAWWKDGGFEASVQTMLSTHV